MNRFLATLFRADQSASNWMKNGDFGKVWPPAIIAALSLLDWLVDLLVVLMLGPGLVIMLKSPRARPVALSIIWFALFYATVFYMGRFRIAVFPAFALAAAAGASSLPDALTRAKAKAAFIIWMIAVVLLTFIVTPPSRIRAFRTSAWTKADIGQGLSTAHKQGFLVIAGRHYRRAGAGDKMRSELGDFILSRQDSLKEESLLTAGDIFKKRRMPDVASFFYSMAVQIFGSSRAGEELISIEAMKKSDLLFSFQTATDSAIKGVMIYRSALPAPVLVSSEGIPLITSLRTEQEVFSHNPGMKAGKGIGPFQYYCEGRSLWIILPQGHEPPSPENPLRVEYYSQ